MGGAGRSYGRHREEVMGDVGEKTGGLNNAHPANHYEGT